MKIDTDAISKLMILRELIKDQSTREQYYAAYDDEYFKSVVPVAIRYKRFEALDFVFDRLGLSKDLNLKERIALWQLLEHDDNGS